ncbi:MAG: hypothetical protein ACLQGT_10580 [Terracidiphilus sp.]
MANLRLKIELNKGKRGISLDKLEKIVLEMRRFLVSMSDDIELVEPASWVAVDFKNGSLEFSSEYSYDVAAPKLGRFNDAIVALARSEFPQSLQRSTANQFFQLASTLEQDETANISVFGEGNNPIPMQISQRTATLARMIKVLPFRETIGSIQGKIHSLYRESKPHPYFTLRELSTENLIKCEYENEIYPDILQALVGIEQVIHVRGAVMSDTRGHSIHHVKVSQIMLADPYGFADVERFLGANRTQ